jgi:SAM-dependent methyltransferase
VADAELDAATLLLVLHHVPDPAAALAEAARALKPGGRLLIADMLPHEHEEYRQQMGHVWLGFSDDQLTRMLESAGFTAVRITALPTARMRRGRRSSPRRGEDERSNAVGESGDGNRVVILTMRVSGSERAWRGSGGEGDKHDDSS